MNKHLPDGQRRPNIRLSIRARLIAFAKSQPGGASAYIEELLEKEEKKAKNPLAKGEV